MVNTYNGRSDATGRSPPSVRQQTYYYHTLNGFKSEKKTQVVAGDGRADSPGHSAKYA